MRPAERNKRLKAIRYEKAPPIARIILNRPEKANAISSEMVWEVDACLQDADLDYDIKVVILKANGKGFCAGHEVGSIETAYPEFKRSYARLGTSHKAHTDLFLWPVLRLWEFPKPIVSQVHGYAIGAGTYFALLPDITVASDDAYFQMPLVQGLGFPGGETMIEPWIFMNWKRAAEYLYTSQTLSAARAYELGLVNRVVPRDELERTTEELAAHIARAPLSTLIATRTLLKRAWELMGMRMHLQMSNDQLTICAAASDVQSFRATRHVGDRTILPRQMAQKLAARKPKSGKK